LIRGLYTAAAGMMTRQAQLDTISQNLANVNTPGYRKDELLVASFPQMLLSRIGESPTPVIGTVGNGCAVDGVYTSFEEGAAQQTGNPLDLALQGNVFFTVRDGQGHTYATRNGNFSLDADRRLVTNTGGAVLGSVNGQPTDTFVPNGSLTVNHDGSLSGAVDSRGQAIDRLYLTAKPAGTDWLKIGDSLFSGAMQAPGTNYSVQQGASEASNVNAIEEMVKMISATRAYEANSKVIQVTDSTLDKVVNSVGNV